MTFDVVPICLGDKWVLVRAEVVSEFLPNTPWLPVPGSTPLIPGVTTWRGRAIPILDLLRALDLGAIAPLDARARIMVIECGLGAVAVPVDSAREVITLKDEELRPPHVSSTPYTTGEVDGKDSVLPLIEIAHILRDVGKVSS